MQKTILKMLGLALIAASVAQIAAAAEQKGRKADLVLPPARQPFRDANASAIPAVQPDWSRYEGRAISAPAGR
jgi:hypothetical protein